MTTLALEGDRPSMELADEATGTGDRRRWAVLAVLCLSLVLMWAVPWVSPSSAAW